MEQTTTDIVRCPACNAGNRLPAEQETTFGSTTVLQPATAGTYLVAEQIDGGFLPPFPSLRTVWYSTNARATGGVYRVSAEFRPAAKDAACQGGVMAWLNAASSNGLVFKLVPAAAGEFLPASFQVARVDFTATTSEANENVAKLFNLDGTPATADITSAWSALDTNYLTADFARFELAFTAPSTNDLAALKELVGSGLTLVNSLGFAITILSLCFVYQFIDIISISYALMILAAGPILGLISMKKLLSHDRINLEQA